LVCDPGYVPTAKTSMQCQVYDSGFDWSVPFSDFSCIKACNLVVGGMNKEARQVTTSARKGKLKWQYSQTSFNDHL